MAFLHNKLKLIKETSKLCVRILTDFQEYIEKINHATNVRVMKHPLLT